MRLIKINGKGANFQQVKDNLVVLACDKDLSTEYVQMFYKHNKAAINLGYINVDYIDSTIERMENGVLTNYIIAMKKAIDGDTKYIDSILSMEYKYVYNFLDVEEHVYNVKQIMHREFKTREFAAIQEQKRLAEIQKEKDEAIAKQEQIEDIKRRVMSNIDIAGWELLLVANDLKLNIPLRTKGLINQCLKINVNEISYPKGNTKKNLTNVFKWIKEVKQCI